MNNDKKISIITPCYNGVRFIDRYINSIINQTYKNIELIIVNDGSSDDSESLLLSYSDLLKNSGIKFIYKYQENAGVGGAIQTGLEIMSGEYFTWVDIDDFIMPNYVEKSIEFLETHLDYGVVRFDGNIISDSEPDKIIGKMADNNHDKFQPHLFENALYQKNFHFGYSVVRTDCFIKANHGRNIYKSRQGQNWQILLPVFYYYKSGYIDECLYTVCEHCDSVSRRETTYVKRIAQIEEYENILLKTLTNMYIPEEEKRKYMKTIKNNYSHRIFRWAISNCDYKRAYQKFYDLKKNMLLTKEEKKQFRRRFLRIEFWMYNKKMIENRLKRKKFIR